MKRRLARGLALMVSRKFLRGMPFRYILHTLTDISSCLSIPDEQLVLLGMVLPFAKQHCSPENMPELLMHDQQP